MRNIAPICLILFTILFEINAQNNIKTKTYVELNSFKAKKTPKSIKQKSHLTISVGHRSAVQHLLISPDSTCLLSSGSDGCIKIWDIKTGVLLNTFKGLSINKKNFDISPDGNYIAAVNNKYQLIVIDINISQIFKVIPNVGYINYIKFIDHGNKIICSSDDYPSRIFDFKTGKKLFELNIVPGVVDYMNDSNFVLTRGLRYNSYSKLVDLKTRKVVYQISKEFNYCAFSDDREKILAANNHGEIKLMKLSGGSVIAKYKPHNRDITTMRLISDKYLFSCSFDGTAMFQNLYNKRKIRYSTGVFIEDDFDYICDGYSMDKAIWSGLVIDTNKIFLGFNDGSIKEWNPFENGPAKVFAESKCPVYKASRINDSLKIHIKGAVWSAKPKNMLNCSIKEVPYNISFIDNQMVYYSKPDKGFSFSYISKLNDVSYSIRSEDPFNLFTKINGDYVLLYNNNTGLELHDFKNKKLKWKITKSKTRIKTEVSVPINTNYILELDNINCMNFSENGKYIAYTGTQFPNKSIIEIRDTHTSDIILSKQGVDLRDVTFCKNDSAVYGSTGTGIIIYSFPEFDTLNYCSILKMNISSYVISNDLRSAAVLTPDKQITLYNLGKKGLRRKVGELNSSVLLNAKFMSNKNILLTIDDGIIKFWSVKNSKMIGELCFIDRQNWIFYTPDNRFHSTEGALKYINLIENGKNIKNHIEAKKLYTPGLIYKILGEI